MPRPAHAAAAGSPDALPRAPIAGLTEPGPGGLLPVIGPDGTRPSRAYARPFHGDPAAPTIAVVVGGMGLNRAVTEAAINDLPPEVALSFAPYTEDLQAWIDRARDAGHEVLIEAPMEPFDYPNNDPGPHTLLADGSAEENGRRLAWLLSRTTGYFGVTNYLGARFSASQDALRLLFSTLEHRGVAFLHDGAGRRSSIEAAANATDIEYAIADRILDEDPTPESIDERLLALEALAIQNGAALGTGFAYPATVEQIAAWAANLDLRGYQLAPPSAVMARRRIEARLAAETQPAPGPAPRRTASAESHAPPGRKRGWPSLMTDTADPWPHHRANVGIALFNQRGEVWLGRRENTPPPWNWQLPQGGIDPGEDAEAAALRELEEETGIAPEKVAVIGRIPGWLAYDYPPDVREDPHFHKKRHLGQKQRWFALRFSGRDGDIDLERHGEVEFDAWRWGDLAEIPDLIIPWKRDVYLQVADAFAKFARPVR